MENNSIKNNLTKEDIISDIILSMGADIDNINVYVLVEGESDINLMHPYLADNVLMYESYDGKSGVEYIVCESFCTNERVIGLRDRDYQLEPISEKVFYYDYGCMEMMIISNDDVFNNLCFEYYKGDMSNKQLKGFILTQLKLLSIIRLHNEREQWGIILNGIPLNDMWKTEKFELDNDRIINRINIMNNNFINEALVRKLKKETIQDWNDEEYYSYTQGHDFFTLFVSICNRYKKRGIKHTEAEASARCIFRWSDLTKTSLYRNITAYSEKRNLKIMSTSA